MLQMWYSYGFIENGILKCNWNVEYFLVSISLSKWEFKSYLLPDKGIEHRSVRRTLSSLSWGLKNIVRFWFFTDPVLLNYMLPKRFLWGWEVFGKIPPKHTFFWVILHFIIMFFYLECTFVIQLSSYMVQQHTCTSYGMLGSNFRVYHC